MLFSWRKKKENQTQNINQPPVPQNPTPDLLLSSFPRAVKTFTSEDVGHAKNELRVSGVEREILGEALTRLYEYSAEGKLTPEERDRLAGKYKEQILKLDSSISTDQKIISLHELEEMRGELMKMFQDKFGELNNKIDEIRKGLGVGPREVPETRPTIGSLLEKEFRTPSSEKPVTTVTTAPAARRVRGADEALEKLRQDLQKELEKLEQIEMEG